MKKFLNLFNSPLFLLAGYLTVAGVNLALVGSNGFFGSFWKDQTILKLSLFLVIMTHLTITCMSLSFHRYHTHKGVEINPIIDTLMQIWLFVVTSMSKLDWVSVHQYHHLHSDTALDPHSPVIKGLKHVLFLGVLDYSKAKNDPAVLKLRAKIKTNALERFIANNLFVGPALNVILLLTLFGPLWGTILGILSFAISPIFAVGGVNALAHWWGYRNHHTKDNSRNVGFIFPLNFLTCGEMDHNNHHAHQRSCSFRHKWYEFDIGYFYLNILSKLHLAQIKSAFTPKSLKAEMAARAKKVLEYDFQFKQKCQALSIELNRNAHEMSDLICAYIEGKKVRLEKPLINFANDLKHYLEWQNGTQAFAL